MLYLGIAMLFAMLCRERRRRAGVHGVPPPLRRRHARSLAFLITAIGMSFVLQEFVHFVLPKLLKGYGGSNGSSRSSWYSPRLSSRSSAPRLQRHAGHRGLRWSSRC